MVTSWNVDEVTCPRVARLFLPGGGKGAVHHAGDVHRALHGVLIDGAIVGEWRLLSLDIRREREMNRVAFDGTRQVGRAELAVVFAGQLLAVLLEGEGRIAAALIGLNGCRPVA